MSNDEWSNMQLEKYQANVIVALERAGATLSLFGILLIVITFVIFKRLRTVPNTFILFASIANIGAGIASLIGLDGLHQGLESSLCRAQAFLLEMFMQSDPWWSFAMAFNVYLVFFHSADPNTFRRYLWVYCLVCFGGPMIPAIVCLYVENEEKGKAYGDATLWCWIGDSWNSVRIYSYYIPIWVCIFLSAVIYIAVGYHVFHQRNQLRNITLSNQAKDISMSEGRSSTDKNIPLAKPGVYGTVTTEVQITTDFCAPQSMTKDPTPPRTPSNSDSAQCPWGDGPFPQITTNAHLQHDVSQSSRSHKSSRLQHFLHPNGKASDEITEDVRPPMIYGAGGTSGGSMGGIGGMAGGGGGGGGGSGGSGGGVRTTSTTVTANNPPPSTSSSPLSRFHSHHRQRSSNELLDFPQSENSHNAELRALEEQMIFSSGQRPEEGKEGIEARRQSLVPSPGPFRHVSRAYRRFTGKLKHLDPIKLAYLRTSFVFAISVLVTWTPSSINRVHALVNPKDSSYPLNIASAAVLPLQGVWNAIIYFTTSWPTVVKEIRILRGKSAILRMLFGDDCNSSANNATSTLPMESVPGSLQQQQQQQQQQPGSRSGPLGGGVGGSKPRVHEYDYVDVSTDGDDDELSRNYAGGRRLKNIHSSDLELGPRVPPRAVVGTMRVQKGGQLDT